VEKNMANPFENVARVAISEMFQKYLVESKFGHFLSDEDLAELENELFQFLQTSRNLRAGGDRFMRNMETSNNSKAPTPSR
jgi:hypothetical protein